MITQTTDTPFILMLDLQASDFQDEWSRCNVLANYIGEYTAYQFTQRERAENLISTIANELLEAATNLATNQSTVQLNITHDTDTLKVIICHKISPEKLSAFETFIESLEPSDSQHYLSLLTSETQPDLYFNQLGLAMLTHDFGVTVSVEKSNSDDEVYCTTTVVSNEEFSA